MFFSSQTLNSLYLEGNLLLDLHLLQISNGLCPKETLLFDLPQSQKCIGLCPQELCQCLDLDPSSDPADFCLTDDDLSDSSNPSDVTVDVIATLRVVWNRVVARPCVTSTNAEEVYEELVAR